MQQDPATNSDFIGRKCFAHTADGPWEPLEDHLERVALGFDGYSGGAKDFANSFNAADWGELAGWWHDLGKYSDEFQDYLKGHSRAERENAHAEVPGRVDHSTAGAQLAASRGPHGHVLAFCIAGHHGGLPDAIGDGSLEMRLEKLVPRPRHADPSLLTKQLPNPPKLSASADDQERPFQIAFFTRMLFSALVDSDFLATESFMAPQRQAQRATTPPPAIEQVEAAIRNHLDSLTSKVEPTAVNRRRAEVLDACRAKADLPPGFFSLTVPTGGGKTLSSLAFAIAHAKRHGLRRVIYAIPFTSIIEQNADVFRDALRAAGPNTVLEHHSNFEPASEDRWSRLASENWDAPVVVTTTVQLYESLFHNRPSRCRKLHNIARSVIVLDEAQSIPVRLLRPTLAALKELVLNYGCTVVLCTATQPAIVLRDDFRIGLPNPTEIVDDVPSLFAGLERVRVEHPRELDDDSLIAELAGKQSVLCIVRTKAEAREIFARLREESGEGGERPLGRRACLHLSTDMCPAHRALVIGIVRQRLKDGLPCRVVSTNLIEAGVDVDFPIVYRSLAGLDAIAQAAGRCNREGLLDGLGRVVLYTNPDRPVPAPMQELRLAIDDARRTIARHDDPLSPEAIEAYFEEHYWKREGEWDAERVMECFASRGSQFPMLQFGTAAERYQLIRDEQTPVVVPWGDRGPELVEHLLNLDEPADRDLRRRCQRFAVGLRPHLLAQMVDARAVIEPPGGLGRGLYVLMNAAAYDETLGLNPSAAGFDPDLLIEGGV